jgi:hypothetical protein
MLIHPNIGVENSIGNFDAIGTTFMVDDVRIN